MNDTQVVKNIQELRRYIQEDCDQLKAGLKASSPFLMNNQSCLISNCDGEVKQCGYEEFEDATNNTFCDTSTQAPPAVDVGGESVSSLYTAFKVMVIRSSSLTSPPKNVSYLQNYPKPPPSDKVLLSSIQSRLTNLTNRCQQLHSSLALQRVRCNKEREGKCNITKKIKS